jgi:serine/threonine-protein kinase RsbW
VLDVLAPSKKNAPGVAQNGACKQLHIPSDPAVACRIQEEVEQALKAHHFDEREVFGIRLALEEALINAIKHGNQLSPDKTVAISYQVTADRFEMHIRDEGAGYDPGEIPDPMAPENLERPCGRGLFLMKHFMTDVVVHPPGNAVSLIKVRDGETNGKQPKPVDA